MCSHVRVRTDTIQYVMGDWPFTLLHVLIELERGTRGRELTVLLLPVNALQSGGLRFLHEERPASASSAPSLTRICIQQEETQLSVAFCDSWAQLAAAAAAVDVRALYIPGMDTMMGAIAAHPQLYTTVLPRMLRALGGRAKQFPPQSHEDLFDHKDRTFALFGTDFMLPALWLPLSSDSTAAVATKLLQWAGTHGNGQFVLKGSWSWGAITTRTIVVAKGECAELMPMLTDLHDRKHQRFVGIQPYESSLREHEYRVYVVPDASCERSGWRQVLCVLTNFTGNLLEGDKFNESAVRAELQLPTHGRSLAVASFVDRLMHVHHTLFQRAAKLAVPLVRIDCGVTDAERCFVSELGCMDQVNFTGVHYQDLAHAQAKGYATELIQMLKQ